MSLEELQFESLEEITIILSRLTNNLSDYVSNIKDLIYTIENKQLYKQKYNTFEEYCQEENINISEINKLTNLNKKNNNKSKSSEIDYRDKLIKWINMEFENQISTYSIAINRKVALLLTKNDIHSPDTYNYIYHVFNDAINTNTIQYTRTDKKKKKYQIREKEIHESINRITSGLQNVTILDNFIDEKPYYILCNNESMLYKCNLLQSKQNNIDIWYYNIEFSNVRVIFISDFLSQTSYDNLLLEIKNQKWEQTVSEDYSGFRFQLDHLEYNIDFTNSINAHVTNFGFENQGNICSHFFHQIEDSHINIKQLHNKVNNIGLLRNNNFIELNQIEEILYRDHGLSKHNDGYQLKKKSSIFTYVMESKSKIRIWLINNNEYIDLPLNKNSLYGFEYIDNNTQIYPRDIKHKKIIHNSHISMVFCTLKPVTFNQLHYLRFQQENAIFKTLNWNNILESKYKIQIINGNINKTVMENNPFIKLNTDTTKYIFKSNYANIFGPGDIFHNNPIVTSFLHIHPFYFNGKAICGNKENGCCSIRIGLQDEIINSSKIYFYGEQQAKNYNILQNKGSTIYLFKSWKIGNKIRVLLGSNVKWYERGNDLNNQYYFNNMFLHECKFIENKKLWRFTLRTEPRNKQSIINNNYKECVCCN